LIRLTPKAGRDEIDGIMRLPDGSVLLKVRVTAAPSEGAANDSLIRLLARQFGLAPRDVTLVGGAASRIKRVRVEGDPSAVVTALERIGEARTRRPRG
jgi:uncharacterized protein